MSTSDAGLGRSRRRQILQLRAVAMPRQTEPFTIRRRSRLSERTVGLRQQDGGLRSAGCCSRHDIQSIVRIEVGEAVATGTSSRRVDSSMIRTTKVR